MKFQGVGALFTVEDSVGYLATVVTLTSGKNSFEKDSLKQVAWLFLDISAGCRYSALL